MAFVHGASEDESERAILKVVAEGGVETEEDWNLVVELGCDQVQNITWQDRCPQINSTAG